jgi:SulP family sulfate permease
MASQLNKLFGVTLNENDFFPRLLELSTKLDQTHVTTLTIGLISLVMLITMRRLAPRIPGALVVCAGAIIASTLLGLQQKGVAVVGEFPGGLPRFSFPEVTWREVHSLTTAAIGIALLTYTEGILLARAFAAKNGYEVSANQELVALGTADIAAGLFQGFSITGSQARTTINDTAGGRTQVSSMVAAITLALLPNYPRSLWLRF